MAYVARSVSQSARNATTTATFTFTPATVNNLLVAICYGAVTFTTPTGWTLRHSAVNSGGLYVFTKVAAAGESTFSSTNNAANYPTAAIVYEYLAGSTYQTGITGTAIAFANASPTLNSITGTNVALHSIVGSAINQTAVTAVTTTWTGTPTPTKDQDLYVVTSGTNGYALSNANVEGSSSASFASTGSMVGTGAALVGDKEAIVVAISVVSAAVPSEGPRAIQRPTGRGPFRGPAQFSKSVQDTSLSTMSTAQLAAAAASVTAGLAATATWNTNGASATPITALAVAIATLLTNVGSATPITASPVAVASLTTNVSTATPITVGLVAVATSNTLGASATPITATATAAATVSSGQSTATPITATSTAIATLSTNASASTPITSSAVAVAALNTNASALLSATATPVATAALNTSASTSTPVTATAVAAATRNASASASTPTTATPTAVATLSTNASTTTPVTVAPTAVATLSTNASANAPVTATATAVATVASSGQSTATPITVGLAAIATNNTLATAATATAVGLTAAATRATLGATATPITATPTSVATLTTSGSTASSIAASMVADATRATSASTSTPITIISTAAVVLAQSASTSSSITATLTADTTAARVGASSLAVTATATAAATISSPVFTVATADSAITVAARAVAVVTAKTRTGMDVRKSVQRVFGDESGVAIEDADILMWINDAQDEIVNRNQVLKGTATTMSVIGQADYTLDPNIRVHQVESIHFNDRLLVNLSFVEAEQTVLYNAVSTMNGTPEVWYEWAGTFTFYPAPSTASPIVLQYSLRPPRLTALASNLSLSEQYFQDIVKYVLQQAYEMSENWQAAGIKGDMFDLSQSDIDEEERKAQHMTNLTIQVID